MKKNRKKLIFVLLLIITIFISINYVYAATRQCNACGGTGVILGGHTTCTNCGGKGYVEVTTSHSAGEIVEEGKKFIEIGESGESKIDSSDLKNLSNTLYTILLVIGIVIAIIVGLILGIKFIMGSIEEKAEIKTMIIPYVIGCVIVFGAFTIWKIVVDILQSM